MNLSAINIFKKNILKDVFLQKAIVVKNSAFVQKKVIETLPSKAIATIVPAAVVSLPVAKLGALLGVTGVCSTTAYAKMQNVPKEIGRYTSTTA